MNLKRIWTLIKNDTLHGPKDVILVISILTPILIALFVNLAFGNIFTDRGKLGIYDSDHSQLPRILASSTSIVLKSYGSESALKSAVSRGSVDMGIVLPGNFDDGVLTGTVNIKAYIWGESLAKNRTLIPIILADSIREMSGSTVPIKIDTVALGDESSVPWSSRLLPLTVLLAVFFGGLMMPAGSLIHEKQRHTLEALNITRATISEIFLAKGVIGAVLAIIMGLLTLTISGGFGNSPFALILVLVLGAIMASEIGLIVGALINDMNTLFAIWKFGGLLLFGPAIVFMFPQIPSWVGYIFPTFYVVKPVMDLSVNGLGFDAIALNVIILAGIVVVMGVIIAGVTRRLSTQSLQLHR